jgi:hypothetical protein
VNPKLGCIPANISAAVEALGIPGLKEKELLDAYLYTISFENIVHSRVLSQFKFNGLPFPDLLSLEVCNSSSFDSWWSYVTNGLRNGGFVLFAFKTNGDSHIRTAVRFDASSDMLETYDPNPDLPDKGIPMAKKELSAWWSSGKLNPDLLSIRRL